MIAIFGVIFLAIFNFTSTLMAGPYIEGDLGGGKDLITYSTTFYGVGNAIGVPLGKPLAKRFGTVRIFVITLILLALFAWLCSISFNFPTLVMMRFFQGLITGPFYALCQNLMTAQIPEEKKRLSLAILITLFATIPALGAAWGGVIAYEYHWRWLFYPNIPLALLIAAYLWFCWRKTDLPQEEPHFNKVEYLFYALALFCLSISIITGQQLDWFRSNLFIVMLLVGIFSLIFAVLWNIYSPHPNLHLRLIKKGVFFFSLLTIAVLFSSYFGMIILLALWLKLYVNYTPLWIGLILGIMGIAGLFPTPLIKGRWGLSDCRIPLCLAILFLAISCFHTCEFNVQINLGRIAISRVIAGCGLALFLPPLFRLSFHTFTEEKSPHVMELFQTVRLLASTLGCAVYSTLWLRRRVFYHDRLGEKLTAFSAQTKTYLAKAKIIHLKGLAAMDQLEIYLDKQATALALDDCFYLMGWILTGLLVVYLLSFFVKVSHHFHPEKTNNNFSLNH